MEFPRRFLDEIRNRVGLAQIIQRRTKLVKKGREWSGLCPFHNEKSPSFTVNEDKGFFHCFGCGAHGDVIGFVMQAESLTFPEAIERLAGEAGLEVPRPTPEARARAERDATLHDVVEAAAQFFQAQLESQAGTAARAYLARRGLDEAAIQRFRLGYAPAGQGLLKQHLLREFPEPLLAEAGLVARREGSEITFDYFRDRVMFPILDRSGKPIAFGGRVMGDAKPKYLNSPDTPIFHKGGVLYGLSWAREGVRKGAEPLVTEGYMDVIALHRAGFAGAVAPLGTALTEDQLGEVWRLGPEPVLCFDGDAAGQKAALRAIERALPLLKAPNTLRFAILPQGEDPDTLIARYGADGMRELLGRARPLVEHLWAAERAAGPLATPEQRAGLRARLLAHAARIGDESLRFEYQRAFKGFFYERLAAPARKGMRGGRPVVDTTPPPDPAPLRRRREEAFVLVALRHPGLLDELVEEFAAIELPSPDLERLRREIINAHAHEPGLDAEALKHHLSSLGLAEAVDALMTPRVLDHAEFALSDDRDLVIASWRQVIGFLREGMGSGPDRDRAPILDMEDLGGLVEQVKGMVIERRRLTDADLPEAERPY
jgi:DNA primase